MTQLSTTEAHDDYAPDAAEIVDLLASIMSDGLDHPEIWSQMGQFIGHLPNLPAEIAARMSAEGWGPNRLSYSLLAILCQSGLGDIDGALAAVEQLAIAYSQSAQVQGVVFYLHALKDPGNPRYQ